MANERERGFFEKCILEERETIYGDGRNGGKEGVAVVASTVNKDPPAHKQEK